MSPNYQKDYEAIVTLRM